MLIVGCVLPETVASCSMCPSTAWTSSPDGWPTLSHPALALDISLLPDDTTAVVHRGVHFAAPLFRVPHSSLLRRVGGSADDPTPSTPLGHRRSSLHYLLLLQASSPSGTARSRDRFVKILAEVRAEYGFALVGYVVMPEHIHLLISEPQKGTPATGMQVLKQRVSRARRRRQRKHVPKSPLCLWEEEPVVPRSFWQRRFYDFNVWSLKEKVEKIAYMHRNPVQRGLVIHPQDWRWSSYAGYERRAEALIAIDFSD